MTWKIIHKYVAMNLWAENRWFIVRADKSSENVEQMQGVLCHYFLLAFERTEQEMEWLKGIHTFFLFFLILRLLCQSQQSTLQIFVKVIHLQCAYIAPCYGELE